MSPYSLSEGKYQILSLIYDVSFSFAVFIIIRLNISQDITWTL